MKIELTKGDIQIMDYIVESVARGRPDVRAILKHPEFASWARKVKKAKEDFQPTVTLKNWPLEERKALQKLHNQDHTGAGPIGVPPVYDKDP